MENYNVDEVLKNIFDHDDRNWKPTDKIQLIVKELEYCKDELKTYLDGSDFDIPGILKESDCLCSKSNLLVENLSKYRTEVEVESMADILKSIKICDHLAKELKSVKFAESLVQDVQKCWGLMNVYHEAVGERYCSAVEALCGILELLDHPSDGFNDLDIAGTTREMAQSTLDNLAKELHTEFDQLLNISVKHAAKERIAYITIKMKANHRCCDIVSALTICSQLEVKMHAFAEILLKEILQPIVFGDFEINFDADCEKIYVITQPKPTERSTYINVITGHMKLLDVLRRKLDIIRDADKSMFEMIGEHISERYCHMMMHECFVYTIPKNIADLNNYDPIAKHIAKFQNYLEVNKFFPQHSNLSTLRYLEDIEKHFAQSAARHLLETARTIMMKDLSATMSIGVVGQDNLSDAASSSSNEEALVRLEKNIPKSLFYFPRCMISKSAQELLDHLYTIMEQASQCKDVVCKKLYCVARMIFDLYEAVVPYHHEKYLQTIPQYVALFHNNCMYLAHNLLTFGDKWVQSLEGREVDYPISFVDLVHKLRDLGYRHLTLHMQQQRKQILTNIRSSDLNRIVVKDVLGDNAEAAVRQCLRQLQLLKNVWIGVLPGNVFTRLMATLVNLLADELIHRLCTVEDISAEMATQLSDMYTIVVQKAPQLFANPADVESHVNVWIKFQELIFVLRGTLKDIDSHWADGSGPLAKHFRTEELRSLIKALFQNTQIRANVLSKIK